MLDQEVAAQTITLLLQGTYKTRQDGGESQFLFGNPGGSLFQHTGGETLYFSKIGILEAALFIRRNGPTYLRALSIAEIRSRLIDFLTSNYGHLAPDTWFSRAQSNLDTIASPARKLALVSEFARSHFVNPALETSLFPLVTIIIEDTFDGNEFFFSNPADLFQYVPSIPPSDIQSDQFPPIREWTGPRDGISSWLGVRAPLHSVARKVRAAVLGAVALLPHRLERYLFTGRKMVSGTLTLRGSATVTFDRAHTPPIAENIKIGKADEVWLGKLSQILADQSLPARRAVKSLEYFYRSWFLSESERFPWLFMSLDALFGDQERATRAVIDGVSPHIGPKYNYERLRLLQSLRASVIHGGAPDVYDSTKYESYFRDYGEDPISDAALITAATLRTFIFEGELNERPHTHSDAIRKRLGVEV